MSDPDDSLGKKSNRIKLGVRDKILEKDKVEVLDDLKKEA
jgi:hypothetical protein